MKNVKRILFFFVGTCLLIACSKSDNFWGDDFTDINLNKATTTINPGDHFSLTGFATYDTWEAGSGKVWQDVDNACTAELVFSDKYNFTFTFLESPKPQITCHGKMANSGELIFEYPVPLIEGWFTITEIIQMHACATIWGEGINKGTLVFKGRFDGISFKATAKFMASVASPCPSNNMFDPSLVNNPLNWTFGYNMTSD